MGTHWDISGCVDLVAQVRAPDCAARFRSAAQALARECTHAEYHGARVRELQGSVNTNRHSDPGRSIMVLMAHAAEGLPSGREFAETRFVGGAHLMACVRCLHAAVDLSGAVLFHALDLGGIPGIRLALNRTYPHTVLEALRTSGRFPNVADPLERMCQHKDVQYIKDVANASKHRMLIGTPYAVSLKFDGSPSPHGFRIDCFEFDGRDHHVRNGLEVVGEMQVRVVSALIETMNALDRELSTLASSGA